MSRADFDELMARVAAIEARGARSRVDLDIHLARIAQLQDEIDLLKRVIAAIPSTSEITSLGLPSHIVES